MRVVEETSICITIRYSLDPNGLSTKKKCTGVINTFPASVMHYTPIFPICKDNMPSGVIFAVGLYIWIALKF